MSFHRRSSRRAAPLALQVLAGIAVAALAVPAAVADPLEVGLGVAVGRIDNRTGGSAPTAVQLRSLRPLVRYTGSLLDWSVDAGAERRFELRSGAQLGSPGRSGDETTDRALLDLKRRWSPFDELHARGTYARTHNVLDADPDALVGDGIVIRKSGELALDLMHFEGQAQIRSTGYGDRPGYETGVVRALAARVVPVRHRIHSLSAGVSERLLTVGPASELRSRAATVGVRRQVDPIHTVAIEAGAAEYRFQDGREARKPTLILAFERTPKRPYALGLEFGMALEGDSLAAYDLEARYLFSTGRLWVRTESLADAQGGAFADPTLVRRFAVGALDTLWRANVLGAEASYANARTLSGPAERRETVRLRVWMLRRVQPWLTARVGGSYAWEETQSAPVEPSSRSMRLDAELIVLHSTRQVEPREGCDEVGGDAVVKEEA